MNLTFALPALNRGSDETVPPLALDAFNQILRLGVRQSAPLMPSEFYARYLWQGSLAVALKRAAGVAPEQCALLAGPVCQQAGLHSVSMTAAGYAGIGQDEAQELCAGLNGFYRDEGWCFHPVLPALWLLALPQPPDWDAAPLWDACGQLGGGMQVVGADDARWLTRQTEIQMWLHGHPVNERRTAAGLPAVNGLWLWRDSPGADAAPAVLAAESPWAVFSDGLTQPMPQDFEFWMQEQAKMLAPNQEAVVFSDGLAATLHSGDVWAYRSILEDWEARWFAPALAAWQAGRLNSLTVCTDGASGGSVCLRRPGAFGRLRMKWAALRTAPPFNGRW